MTNSQKLQMHIEDRLKDLGCHVRSVGWSSGGSEPVEVILVFDPDRTGGIIDITIPEHVETIDLRKMDE